MQLLRARVELIDPLELQELVEGFKSLVKRRAEGRAEGQSVGAGDAGGDESDGEAGLEAGGELGVVVSAVGRSEFG